MTGAFRSSRWVAAWLLAGALSACRQEAGPPASARSDPPGPSSTLDSGEAQAYRARLLSALESRGALSDERVVAAMQRVARQLFVPGASVEEAYEDRPLRIGLGQTISQPTVVAMMTEALALDGHERVLEIGTGSGYQAAILSLLCEEVDSIELLPELGEAARARLTRLGYANVHVRIGDGYRGWPEHAPFDRVLLTAAPHEVPRALFEQLREGGTLIAPVGPSADQQKLMRYRKNDGRVTTEDLGPVRFVPMVPGR
jgi:protein-L-isoaspartate(D-aspartate) O-methyltransferase